MKNIKILCKMFLLCIMTKTNGMELISPTVQDRIITPAILLGIGAAGGVVQAALVNYINKQNNIDDRCSILKGALFGTLAVMPAVIIEQTAFVGNNKPKGCFLTHSIVEITKNLACTLAYSEAIKTENKSLNTSSNTIAIAYATRNQRLKNRSSTLGTISNTVAAITLTVCATAEIFKDKYKN